MDKETRQANRAELADLEREATVTAHDNAIAPRFWATYGTPLLRRLLNAVKKRGQSD